MRFGLRLLISTVLVLLMQGLFGMDLSGARFEAGDGKFLLDGKPFVIKAAELHYPRIPREYWEQRIQMCKALGMNTICLYSFWNVHEPLPDEYDFSGNNDIREFIKLCQKNGMYVILRPGPYVCAEWEMGGLPWWLLLKPDIALRENDPYFIERVALFQEKLADQTVDLIIENGGPILMVQVENEYGSYGVDKGYVANIRDILRKRFGKDVTLFQCDWSSNFLDNGLDDLLWTLNFGAGADVDEQFAPLKKARPDSPLMCSEYWSGWFDKWGAPHETRQATEMIAGLGKMLQDSISFSLYMTHGGTNFGHWAGANSPGYAPDVTSYDYDAPITESGQPTDKYFMLRNLLSKYSDTPLPELPPLYRAVKMPEIVPVDYALLYNLYSKEFTDNNPMPMEFYGQGFGTVSYFIQVDSIPARTKLVFDRISDFAVVRVDYDYVGTIDRRLGENSIDLPKHDGKVTIELTVEGMGRINFGRGIKDYKGIVGDVALVTQLPDGRERRVTPDNWFIGLLPDDYKHYSGKIKDNGKPLTVTTVGDEEIFGLKRLPVGVYTLNLRLDSPDEINNLGNGVDNGYADTFLDMSSWGKGVVYVNGHPLGRFWEIGPQQTLYLPGAWLKQGDNEILVFDLLGPREVKITASDHPIIDMLQDFTQQVADYSYFVRPDVSETVAILQGEGVISKRRQNGNAIIPINSDLNQGARFVELQIFGAGKSDNAVSVSELRLYDSEGTLIPNDDWRIVYVDSEEAGSNHGASKLIDLQESTYWRTIPGKQFPQSVIIDLGKNIPLGGFEVVPRMEKDTPEAPSSLSLILYP